MPYFKRFSYWFLTIYILFGVGRDLLTVVTHQRTSDYYIFQLHGMTNAFFVVLAMTVVLDLAASLYVLRPSPGGQWVIAAAFALTLFYNITALLMATADLEGVKQAYMLGREARGLPVRQEAADVIFSREGMTASLAFAAVLSAAAFGALWLNRDMFRPLLTPPNE